MIAKYFATSLAIGERGQRAPGDEQLLADAHDVDELGRVGVEIDHVAGLLRRRGSRVHRDPDVRLGERRGVVGAVAGHRDQVAAGLFASDELHLVFWRRLGEEVVDAGLRGDRPGGQRVVAGDHDRADAHSPKFVEPLGQPLLDDILQVHDAEYRRGPAGVAAGDDERRSAGGRDPGHAGVEFRRPFRGQWRALPRPRADGRARALPDLAAVRVVDAAHPGLRGERHGLTFELERDGNAARPSQVQNRLALRCGVAQR